MMIGSGRVRGPDRQGSAGHGAGAGIVAAMAMSGFRLVTTQLGLVQQVPPEAVLEQKAPQAVQRIPATLRPVFVELTHWSYGGLGGAAFGLLPGRLQDRRWSGPAYGVGAWMFFELLLAPLLGLRQAKQTRAVERMALAADHVLYGVIVASGQSSAR